MDTLPREIVKIILRFMSSGRPINLAWLTIARSVCRLFNILVREIAVEKSIAPGSLNPHWFYPGSRGIRNENYLAPHAAVEMGATAAANWLIALHKFDYDADAAVAQQINDENCVVVLEWLSSRGEGGLIALEVLVDIFRRAVIWENTLTMRLALTYLRDRADHKPAYLFEDLLLFVSGGQALSLGQAYVPKPDIRAASAVLSQARCMDPCYVHHIGYLLKAFVPYHPDEVVADLVQLAMEKGCSVYGADALKALGNFALRTYYVLATGLPNQGKPPTADIARLMGSVALQTGSPKEMRRATQYCATADHINHRCAKGNVEMVRALEECCRKRAEREAAHRQSLEFKARRIDALTQGSSEDMTGVQ
jgi:hypothetical protein